MAQTYKLDIPSIRLANPGVPAVLGTLNLDRGIISGQPIDQQNLDDAQIVAESLKCIAKSGTQPLITGAVAESARLRMVAVESAHASAAYTPVNLTEQLQAINDQLQAINNRLEATNNRLTGVDDRLTTIDTSLAIVSAKTDNNRIIGYNSRLKPTERLRPLKKTIAGDGLQKAQAVRRNVIVNAPGQVYAIGSTPPNFNGEETLNYGDVEILNLIIFYNDDFEILPTDNIVVVRRNKLRIFLTEF